MCVCLPSVHSLINVLKQSFQSVMAGSLSQIVAGITEKSFQDVFSFLFRFVNPILHVLCNIEF